ncbi:MAG: hypothetical protein LBK54_12655 [Propionibacteriaceae bacterium]|nr:hypothetical protein [Propionibacteriaceae bacterium]
MLVFSSCSAPIDGEGGSPSNYPRTRTGDTYHAAPDGGALLDWKSATITLPIDRYGMSLSEMLMVEAAGGLEFARCVWQTDDYPPAAVEEAVRYIGSTPMANHWRYGSWDADYMARHGYEGVLDDPLMLLVGQSREQNQVCLERMRGMGLALLSSEHIGDSSGAPLGRGSWQSYEQTMADPAFLSLLERWRNCVGQAGYAIETDSPANAVKKDHAWSEEQMLRANLVEAECADSMGYTQQVADIEAAYQLEYIRQHEAELVRAKQEADERLATATRILREAGVA